MSRIGLQIKKMRESGEMTRKQLGKAVGVTEGFILDIESGKKVISDDLIKKISKALGQEINDLMVLDVHEESPEEKKAIMQKAAGTPVKTVEQKVQKVQEVWSDALDSVLKAVPMYEYDLTTVIGTRQLPVVSNKVEGLAKDKVLFLQIQENDMIGFRIIKGDVAFAYTTHEVENNSICLVEYNAKRVIRQIKRLDSDKILIVSNDGRLSTETVPEKNLKVLARLVKLEIKL